MIFLKAPLEQFQILAFIPIYFLNIDLSITNFFIINIISILIFSVIVFLNRSNNNCLYENCFYFLPNLWQKFIELLFEVPADLIANSLLTSKKINMYFPVITLLFIFILISNLIGLIPYSFTATSHIFVTLLLSFSVFIGITLSMVNKYQYKVFSLFLPSNTSFFLALVLVPIEFISYVAKPISLGVRLFINLMAGHSLLKVIVGFAWSMLALENVSSIGLCIPLLVLIILYSLELSVALIQTYVFVLLACIYIQDANL